MCMTTTRHRATPKQTLNQVVTFKVFTDVVSMTYQEGSRYIRGLFHTNKYCTISCIGETLSNDLLSKLSVFQVWKVDLEDIEPLASD